MPTLELDRLISGAILRIRMKSPFFATLALFTHFRPSDQIPTAATDGKDIFYNPDFIASLEPKEVDGVMLHEVLHAALLHTVRRGTRQAQVWNIAADIVVNGAIAEQGTFILPKGHLRDESLEHRSVEEVYELLLSHPPQWAAELLEQMAEEAETMAQAWRDLLDQPPSDCPADSSAGGSVRQSQQTQLKAHWKAALQRAVTVARSTRQQGNIPAGIRREIDEITAPQLDWRTYLWRYLVQTPTDFAGFDRRFIGEGLYLETLQGESVQVFVAIDTSGSISDEQMRQFLGEVLGILRSYPHLQGELYYVDATAYGPYAITEEQIAERPLGGGGTSFIPFFEQVAESWDGQQQAVCVYLTDGYGAFPTLEPELPTLWVVTSDGLELEQFPFGETVRLFSV
ncbi:MAG: hypothetical protein F6J87_00025 [Spirulina sp. SIO3F2]|nr:hypothetical protein [Spirulina sp. SIO3F2]